MATSQQLFHLESEGIMRDIVSHCVIAQGSVGYTGADPEKTDVLQLDELHSMDLLVVGLNTKQTSSYFSDAIELCKNISKSFPGIRIIVHAASLYTQQVIDLAKAGVKGFADKALGFEDLGKAITEIINGNRYVNARVAGSFINPAAFMNCQDDMLRAKYSFPLP